MIIILKGSDDLVATRFSQENVVSSGKSSTSLKDPALKHQRFSLGIRQLRRQSVRQIIVPDNDSSSNNYSNQSNDELIETGHQEQQSYVETSYVSINVQYESFETNIDYLNDDINWISEEEYEYDKRSLYHGSSITVTNAIYRITNFYSSFNLDKQKVNALLRLIKSLVPKPNLLPSTLKHMNKAAVHCFPSTSTSLLCADCYQPCNKVGIRSEMCVNSNCSTCFRVRRATEVIEIVRFNIRSQIQTVMNRNIAVINKSELFYFHRMMLSLVNNINIC